MNAGEKKYNLSLLKYLRQQPSKAIGEINYRRDLEAAAKIRAFFERTTLSEIAGRAFDRKQFRFGVRIERAQFDFGAYTAEQYDLALSYRTQMRTSRDSQTAYLLLADYIPTSSAREVDLFVTAWCSVDALLFWMLTGCCGIYCVLVVLLALDRSPALWAFVTDAGTLILVAFAVGHIAKWLVARRYLTTFETLYTLSSDGLPIDPVSASAPPPAAGAVGPAGTNMDDIDI